MYSLGRPSCQPEHPFKSPAPASNRFDNFYDSSPSTDSCCHQERDGDLFSMHNRWDAQAKAESSVDVTELVKPTQSLVLEPVAEVSARRNSIFELPSLWFSDITKDKSQWQDHEPHETDCQITKKDSHSIYRGIFESLVPSWLQSVFEFSSATKDEGNLNDDISSLSDSDSSQNRVNHKSEYYKDRDIGVPLVITFVPSNGTSRSKANESSFFGLNISLPIPWRQGGDEASVASKSTSLADIGRTLLLPVIKQLGEIFNLKLDTSASTEKESGCTKLQNTVNQTKHTASTKNEPDCTKEPNTVNQTKQWGSGEATTTFQSPKNCGGVSDSELLYSFNSAQRGRRSMYRRQVSSQGRSSFDGQESSVFLDSRRSSVKSRRSCSLITRRSQRKIETRRSSMEQSASRRSLYERQGSIQSLVFKASRRDLHQRQRSCCSLGCQISPQIDELTIAQDHRSKWKSQSQRHRSIQSNLSRTKSDAYILQKEPINQTPRRRQSRRSYSLDPSRRSMYSNGMYTQQNASNRSLLSKHSQIAKSPKRDDSEMKTDHEHELGRRSPYQRKRSKSLSFERQGPSYSWAISQQNTSRRSLQSQTAKSEKFETKMEHEHQSKRTSPCQRKRSKSLSYERQGSFSWANTQQNVSSRSLLSQISKSPKICEMKINHEHQSRRRSPYQCKRSKSLSYERQGPTFIWATTQQNTSSRSLLSQISKSPKSCEMKIDHEHRSRMRPPYQCKRSKSLSYERQGPSYSWTSMDSLISPQIDDYEVKMDRLHQSRKISRYKRQRSKSFSSSRVDRRVTRRSLDSNAGCLRASVSTRQRQLQDTRCSFIRSSSKRSLYRRQNSCPSFQSNSAAVRRLDDPTSPEQQLICNLRNDDAWHISESTGGRSALKRHGSVRSCL